MRDNFLSALKKISVIESEDQESTYRMGVIDFLTAYNTAKKMETTWNTMLHWNERDAASC